MSWARIDDHANEHPKLLQVGGEAAWLWACGLMYANRQQRRDGVIPVAALPILYPCKSPKRLAQKLVAAGLWEICESGYKIHDYLDWNHSREQVEASRVATKKRVQRHREKRKGSGAVNATSNAVTDASVTQPCNADVLDPNQSKPIQSTPHSPPEGGPIGCPSDLRLTPGQVATISMNCGLTEHQERAITGYLVAKWVDGARRMPIDGWRKYLASAVQRELSSKKWPRDPPPNEEAKQSTATRWVVGADGAPI